MDGGWIPVKKLTVRSNLFLIFFKKGKKMNFKNDLIVSIIGILLVGLIFAWNAKIESWHQSMQYHESIAYDQISREVLVTKNE